MEIFLTSFCNILCYVGNTTKTGTIRLFTWKNTRKNLTKILIMEVCGISDNFQKSYVTICLIKNTVKLPVICTTNIIKCHWWLDKLSNEDSKFPLISKLVKIVDRQSKDPGLHPSTVESVSFVHRNILKFWRFVISTDNGTSWQVIERSKYS